MKLLEKRFELLEKIVFNMLNTQEDMSDFIDESCNLLRKLSMEIIVLNNKIKTIENNIIVIRE